MKRPDNIVPHRKDQFQRHATSLKIVTVVSRMSSKGYQFLVPVFKTTSWSKFGDLQHLFYEVKTSETSESVLS